MNILLIVFAIINTAFAESIDHLKVAYWKNHIPNIVLCNNVNISQSNIEEAVARWERRGINIGKIIRKSCRDRPQHGEIAIYANDQITGNTYHGYAVRSVYTNTNSIAYARIWIRHRSLNSVDLIEHEIGHGLGYKDTNDTRSVMSSTGS